MEIKEEWKDIEGYEGLYQCSNIGRVKSLNYLHTKKERVLKQGIDKYGYLRVNLYKEGKKKYYQVHRLIATTFIDNHSNYLCVNHKNEQKTDNRVDNLEWVTHKQNCNYATRNERIGKAQQKPILQFNREGTKILGKWKSARQVSEMLGIDNSNINKCCRGEHNFCGGFKWMYAKDYYNARILNRMRTIFTKLSELKQVS